MSGVQRVGLLVIGFVIGIALMGMQMLLSRPMTTAFGGGLIVWSSLISVTMLAMMVGYYAGGRLADRAPRSELLGIAIFLAAIYFAVAPPLLQLEILPGRGFEQGGVVFPGPKDSVLSYLSDNAGQDPSVWGALAAAGALVFVPFALMSLFSPFCIRLLLDDARAGGQTSGSVYAITTFGNIVGTLGTSFVMMPHVEVSVGVMMYSVVLAVCGLALVTLRVRGGHGAAAA